jgi:hypothetical protein
MKIILWSCLGFASLLFIVLTGSSSAQNRTAVTQNAVATVEVAAQMEPLPTNCGIPPKPMTLSPQITSVIGTWPLLVGVPNFPDPRKGALVFPTEHNDTDALLPGWWVTKTGWLVSQTYEGTVKVRGFNIIDHSPIYFNLGRGGLVTTAELDPTKDFSIIEGLTDWSFFPSNIWVSKAGCYRIEAEWNGGSWWQVLAVGSISDKR